MRKFAFIVCGLVLTACQADAQVDAATESGVLTYQGADYTTEAEKIAHGQRLTEVLTCTGCHRAGLVGRPFPPDADFDTGIYASNLTRVMANYSDADFDRLLRQGVHPVRPDLYMMPSATYQHLADADVAALYAYLQTLKPTGEELPASQPTEELLARWSDDLEEMAERGLERRDESGNLVLPTMVDEVAWVRSNPAPDLGEDHALGRYIAMTSCAECHGSTLANGWAPALPVVGANYDTAGLTELLTTGTPVGREEAGLMSYIGREHSSFLTEEERAAVVGYVLAIVDGATSLPE